MSTISKEAKDEAVRVYWSIGDPISNIAAALQLHMDATARQAEHTAHYMREADDQRKRAEAAEAALRAEFCGYSRCTHPNCNRVLAEPLCKVCGAWERSDQHHRTYLADHHAFKP